MIDPVRKAARELAVTNQAKAILGLLGSDTGTVSEGHHLRRHLEELYDAALDQAPTQVSGPPSPELRALAARVVSFQPESMSAAELKSWARRLAADVVPTQERIGGSAICRHNVLAIACVVCTPAQEPVPEAIERRPVAWEAQDVVNAARKVAALRLVGTQDARLERELDDALAAFDALRAERETKP